MIKPFIILKKKLSKDHEDTAKKTQQWAMM